MIYVIQNKLGQVIDTNIVDSELLVDLLKCVSDCERVFCKTRNLFRRQCCFHTDNLNIFFGSYDQNITNKIFKYYKHSFIILSTQLDHNIQNVKSKESQKTRRLKHNLITHSTNILQELYKLFPQETFRNGSNHIENIENIIIKDTKKSAYTFLKILKNSNLMKAEFDVYEMLDTEKPYLDFSKHPIHKVLILTLNPFWLDLVEQNVSINIDTFYGTVTIDYKSISVVLSHIFDNMTKYIMPYSNLHISFTDKQDKVFVYIEMNSIKVETNELNKLFTENYSGSWAKKLDLDGDGIGMYIVKQLTEMNNGKVAFEINVDHNSPVVLNGIPYERNRITIELVK